MLLQTVRHIQTYRELPLELRDPRKARRETRYQRELRLRRAIENKAYAAPLGYMPGFRSPTTAEPSWTPLSDTSVTPILWLRADTGIYEADGTGTGGSHWLDISPNARDATQATLGLRPPWSATGGPDGTPCFDNAGTGWLLNEWTPPAPGTTPYFIWMIARTDTFVANCPLVGGQSSTRATIRNNTTSPNLIAVNQTASGNATMTPGNWYLIEALFNNSVSTPDFLKVGAAAAVTGTWGNNAAATGWGIFAFSNGTGICNARIAEIYVSQGVPATRLTNFLTYKNARYPSALSS